VYHDSEAHPKDRRPPLRAAGMTRRGSVMKANPRRRPPRSAGARAGVLDASAQSRAAVTLRLALHNGPRAMWAAMAGQARVSAWGP